MREVHPDVKFARESMRVLRHRIADVRERIEGIVARRPSPSGLAIPEVDVFGRLRDLYLAPGTCARMTGEELAADITAAIVESAEDAKRQYYNVMRDPATLAKSLAEVMREQRSRSEEPPSRPRAEDPAAQPAGRAEG